MKLEPVFIQKALSEIPEPTGNILTFGEVNKYIGIEVVYATPMNRKDYNDLRGWELPADENGEDEGYLVECIDGGSHNVPGFVGYISWRPKEVFERTHHKSVDKVETFLDQLIEERKQLIDRLDKLNQFIDSEPPIKEIDMMDLVEQQEVMTDLAKILSRRIDRLS